VRLGESTRHHRSDEQALVAMRRAINQVKETSERSWVIIQETEELLRLAERLGMPLIEDC
jgi:hypothetical protein